ncbi:MAG: hypothetical protein R3191_06650 [Anaerolineales bacterium]|nr:hypothetical protein [Anaerolineales bacterium]
MDKRNFFRCELSADGDELSTASTPLDLPTSGETDKASFTNLGVTDDNVLDNMENVVDEVRSQGPAVNC